MTAVDQISLKEYALAAYRAAKARQDEYTEKAMQAGRERVLALVALRDRADMSQADIARAVGDLSKPRVAQLLASHDARLADRSEG